MKVHFLLHREHKASSVLRPTDQCCVKVYLWPTASHKIHKKEWRQTADLLGAKSSDVYRNHSDGMLFEYRRSGVTVDIYILKSLSGCKRRD